MVLPSETRSHHTVWVDFPGDTPRGRTSAEVEATLESIRTSRRFVVLER